MRSLIMALLLSCSAASVFLSAATAKADLLFEPRLGYNLDSISANTSGGAVKYTSTGPTIGLKLGYSLPILSFSVMYDYASLNSSVTSNPGGGYTGGSETRSSLYAVLGAHIPFFQAYLGYGFIDDWNYKATSMGSSDVIFHSPGSIKLGAGFTGLPIIAINLEYTLANFTKYTDTSDHDLSSGSTYTSASGNSIMLVVSAPFYF